MSPYSEQLVLELRRLGVAHASLERLLAELPQGLMLAEARTGRILFASQQVSSILGPEIAKMAFVGEAGGWAVLHAKDGRSYTTDEWPLARAMRGDVVTGEEILMVRPDGTKRWIRAAAAPLTGPDGTIAAAVVIFHDVSEQRDAERRATALGKLARRLSAARTAADVYRVIVDHGRRTLDAYAGGIVAHEGDGAWLQFIETAGYPEELLAQYHRFPADAPVPAAHALRSGEPMFLSEDEWRLRFQGPATASATRAVAVLPLRAGDRIVAALTLSFDKPRRFTDPERQFMEALADQCGQALERALLYDAEREARAAAEAASRAKDEFLAMVSHELRTPLNAMSGWVTILRQKTAQDDPLRTAIDAVARSAATQVRLVDDLLDLSRAVSGKLRMTTAPVSLSALVRAALDAAMIAAAEKGVHLQLDADDGAEGQLQADQSRLEQAVGNLLSNAIKFTPSGGTVTLRLERTGANVALTVGDTGQGIEPSMLPFVFDRFRQGAAGRDGDGLGLGLAIVRYIVQAHGGVVYAHNRPRGTGAAFTILLPVAPGAQPAGGAAVQPSVAGMLDGVSVLALLADGAPATQRIMSALAPTGATLRVVSGAAAACEEIERQAPHVILCDVASAGSEGAAFIHRLRESEAGARVRLPVAALTPPAWSRQSPDPVVVGCNAWLAEPIDAEQLACALRALGGREVGTQKAAPPAMTARRRTGAPPVESSGAPF